MTKPPRRQRLKELALIASLAATISVTACATNAPGSTTTVTGETASPSATAASRPGSCKVNPSSAPMPTTEQFEPVPADARISVTMTGIPSGTVKPGDPATEVDVTLCNNSPVDCPKVGVVLVLTRCNCATTPIGLPEGTAERFDPAAGTWIKLRHPVITTGMDYLGGFDDVQEMPKGKAVTLRYRVALDASMADGKGGVQATAVVPDPLVQIGKADLPFTVSGDATAPLDGPRSTVLPFTGLTYPSSVAVSTVGDIYLTDTFNDRVLKLAAGSNEQTVLPFTGLESPGGVAVDSAGNVYVTDHNDRVVKLAAGSSAQSVLPLSGLSNVGGVVGSNEQSVLPFTGIKSANAVAVDSAGSVYVNDCTDNRVLKLAAGATEQTALPLTGLKYPEGLAVDAAGDLYFIDTQNRQLVKVGPNDQTAVPSTGLNGPTDVAVDGGGNLYVVDSSGFGQVVKLEVN